MRAGGSSRDGSGAAAGSPPRGRFDLLFPLAAAAGVALPGLFIHLRWYPIGNMGVETDFYEDLGVAARRIAAGRFSAADFPHKGPLYPFLVAALHALAGDWYRSAVFLNLLCAAGALALVYALLLRLFRRSAAAAATLMLAASSPFFIDAHKAATDHLFFVLALGSLFLLLRPGARLRDAAGAGILAGLSLLTRYNAAALLPAGLVVLLWLDPERRRPAERLRCAGIFLGAFLAVWAPWGILSLAQTGHLVPPANLNNVALEYFPDPGVPGRAGRSFGSFGAILAADPLRFLGHFLANIPRQMGLDFRYVLDPLSALLILLGCLRLFLRPPTRRQTAFYLTVLLYLVSLALVFYLPRVRFLVHAALFALAFSVLFGDEREGSSGAADRVGAIPAFHLSWDHGLRPFGLAVAVAALMLLPNLYRTIRVERVNLRVVPLDVLPAAAYLREHVPHTEEDAMLSLKPHLPFLAGMRYQGYPWEVRDYGDLLRYIRRTGVRFVAIGEREVRGVPGMLAIAQADSLPGLRLVYADTLRAVFAVPESTSARGTVATAP